MRFLLAAFLLALASPAQAAPCSGGTVNIGSGALWAAPVDS